MESKKDWFLYEKEAIENGYNIVCGVDEAGRGPLAGPVFSAAVILKTGEDIEGLNDSKKISEKKRELLFDVIKERAVDYSVAFATEEEVDELNILNATFLAMKRAICGVKVKPQIALIDGNRLPSDLGMPARAIIKGDSLSASIAAASILAKVSRDRLMREISEIYPEYGFEKHKGYGTKLHEEALQKYGPCKIHRRSFLRKILGKTI